MDAASANKRVRPKSIQQRRCEAMRARRGPAGISCPHCHATRHIYFSSAQLRRPVHQRLLFAWLRCHRCTHRFKRLRTGSLMACVAGLAFAVFAGLN